MFVMLFELCTLLVLYLILISGYNVERIEAVCYLLLYSLFSIPFLVYRLIHCSCVSIMLCDVCSFQFSYSIVIFVFMLFVVKLPLLLFHC